MKKVCFFIGTVVFLLCFYIAGPGCPQQAFFGISCPGCGMTRAYIQLLQGNVQGAFFYHPAFFLVPLAVLLFCCQKKLPGWCFQAGMSVILVIFIGVYFYRMLRHDPVLVCDVKQGYLYKIWKAASDIW